MFQKIIAVLGSLTLMAALLITTNASLAATPPKQEDLAVLQKICSVIHIQLHGKTHTTTCLKARTQEQSPRGVVPALSSDNSCSRTNDTISVYLPAQPLDQSIICFSGTGYMGMSLRGVKQISNLADFSMWALWYEYGGKSKTTFSPTTNSATASNLVTDGSALLTQLCYAC